MRYRMLPYIYSMAWDVTHNHGSYMHALVSDFPEDQKVWNMAHEYMFGKSLLVAPIVNAQYTPEKTVAVDPMSGWDRKEGGDNAGLKIDPWTDTKTHVLRPPPRRHHARRRLPRQEGHREALASRFHRQNNRRTSDS